MLGEGEREKSVRRDLVQTVRTMVEEVRDGAGEEGGEGWSTGEVDQEGERKKWRKRWGPTFSDDG